MPEVLGGVRCPGGMEWGVEVEGRGGYLLQAAHFADGEAEARKGE